MTIIVIEGGSKKEKNMSDICAFGYCLDLNKATDALNSLSPGFADVVIGPALITHSCSPHLEEESNSSSYEKSPDWNRLWNNIDPSVKLYAVMLFTPMLLMTSDSPKQ